MFTSNAKRLDGSSSSMDFVDGSADAAAAAAAVPVILSTTISLLYPISNTTGSTINHTYRRQISRWAG